MVIKGEKKKIHEQHADRGQGFFLLLLFFFLFCLFSLCHPSLPVRHERFKVDDEKGKQRTQRNPLRRSIAIVSPNNHYRLERLRAEERIEDFLPAESGSY